MIPTTTKLITGAELLEMGDLGRCELVAGEIVQMSPTNIEHAFLENEIGRLLGNWVAKHKLGWVLVGEVGVFTQRDPDTVRGADVAFISKERLPRLPKSGFLEVAPELVVEVISPTDRWADLHDKLEEYFAIGVSWVWVVEPRRRAIRVYHSPLDVRLVEAGDTLAGEGVLAGFTLPVADLFK